MKRLKKVVLFIALAAIIILNFYNNIFEIPSAKDLIENQFNMITISSVFAGFAFTALGILLGLSNEEVIKKLKGTDIIQKYTTKLIRSIRYFCVSAFLSLAVIVNINQMINYFLALIDKKIKVEGLLNNFFYMGSVYCLVLGIFHFMISINYVFKLISKVYDFRSKFSASEIGQLKNEMEITKAKINSTTTEEQDIFERE